MRAYWADAIWAFGGRRDRGGKVAPMSSTIFSAFAKWSRSRYTIAKWGEKLPHKTARDSTSVYLAGVPTESNKQYPKKLTELHKCEMKILGVHLPWDGHGPLSLSRSCLSGARRRNFDADGRKELFVPQPPPPSLRSSPSETDGRTDGRGGRADRGACFKTKAGLPTLSLQSHPTGGVRRKTRKVRASEV